MRNTLTLTEVDTSSNRKEMPVKTAAQRKKVYEVCLANKELRDKHGLCFMLQFLMLGIPFYSTMIENYRRSSELFPEFGKWYNKMISYEAFYYPVKMQIELYDSNQNMWRRKCLEDCIESCDRQIGKRVKPVAKSYNGK